MKLIMENWHRYLIESETQSKYGILYLFEGETVRETSFYDAINILSESDDDIGIFLENWEKSIDYIFSQLDEQDTGAAIDKAYMDATLQGYEVLIRAKDKAFAPIIKLSDKLKKFGEKNPKTAKAIKLTGGVLLLAAAAAKIAAIMQAGGDASAVEQVAQAVASIDPAVGQEVQEVAQNFTPETVIDFAEEAKQTVAQTADTLAQTDDPGLQQIAQASEQVSNEISEFEQMMIDKQQGASGGGEAEAAWEEYAASQPKAGGDEAKAAWEEYLASQSKAGDGKSLRKDHPFLKKLMQQFRADGKVTPEEEQAYLNVKFRGRSSKPG